LQETNKKKSLKSMAILAGGLLVLNILLNLSPWRPQLDVTGDKRFSLTKPTKEMLVNLEADCTVEVYLEGDFPAGFKRLQSALKDMLADMRGQSTHIHYSYINPNEGSQEEINTFRTNLQKDGIMPVNLTVKGSDKTEEKLIFPFAKVFYRGHSTVVNLLENQAAGTSQEVILNNSVSLLEYKIANAISKLTAKESPIIAFVKGHGELQEIETADLEKSLREYYTTMHIVLDSVVQIKPKISCVVIARPRGELSDKDKFKLDQYIMQGGKVVWCIDRISASTDSLMGRKEFLPVDYNLGIDYMLFKYGVRINPNILLDMRCSRIPLAVGMVAGQPQFDLKPWYYHVLSFPQNSASVHPIVKNLDGIQLYYPATIDTVTTKTPVKKTPLLFSSEYSKVQFLPVRINFDIVHAQPNPADFPKRNLPLAYLLEGSFQSFFENRVTPEMQEGLKQLGTPFRNIGVPTKMVVIGDGDILRNDGNMAQGSYKPLGMNAYEKYKFANKDFMMNVIEYLLDNNGVMEARGKEVKLRLMNRTKARDYKLLWQLANITLPLILLIIFGVLFSIWRKRKFA
jgi:ABC-2 type transport system permease protein